MAEPEIKIVVGGDFNADLKGKKSTYGMELERFNLQIGNYQGGSYKRKGMKGMSKLDFILVANDL